MNWRHFEDTEGWREIVATVKERMLLITRDLLNPEVCRTKEEMIKLQAEYGTCLWFINIPKIDTPEEEVNEGAKKDRSESPDLEPFRSGRSRYGPDF